MNTICIENFFVGFFAQQIFHLKNAPLTMDGRSNGPLQARSKERPLGLWFSLDDITRQCIGLWYSLYDII